MEENGAKDSKVAISFARLNEREKSELPGESGSTIWDFCRTIALQSPAHSIYIIVCINNESDQYYLRGQAKFRFGSGILSANGTFLSYGAISSGIIARFNMTVSIDAGMVTVSYAISYFIFLKVSTDRIIDISISETIGGDVNQLHATDIWLDAPAESHWHSAPS